LGWGWVTYVGQFLWQAALDQQLTLLNHIVMA
jgi:hypothetical protein